MIPKKSRKHRALLYVFIGIGVAIACILGWKTFQPDLGTIPSFLTWDKKIDPQKEPPPRMMEPPPEAWTSMPEVPNKKDSVPIFVNKNNKLLGKIPIFLKRENSKESLVKVLNAYQDKVNSKGGDAQEARKAEMGQNVSNTSAPTTKEGGKRKETKSDAMKWQLEPILILYSNWDENPDLLPKVDSIKNQNFITLSPINNNVRKTPLQTLQEISLIYIVPQHLSDQSALATIQVECAQSITPLTNTKDSKPATSTAYEGAKIRARLIQKDLTIGRWRPDFIQSIPTNLTWTKDRILITKQSKYLEIRAQTTKGTEITLNPLVIIMENNKDTSLTKPTKSTTSTTPTTPTASSTPSRSTKPLKGP